MKPVRQFLAGEHMKTSKRAAINTLEADINTAISKLYNVSMSISKNARAIAIELIKMG